MAEAAALTATANKIIQDADSVGTALKTTSLRLRGTDVKVLEEEGLDSEGAVASKSKLQSKVKALSGVDILTATGEYKSTYEILSEIADVWEKIDDMDQAALLELISGKRNSSVIAAILQNPEELKEAFEDANNASGSALKENEKYLDSIQGKIDQFNNAVQSMWSDTLDSDVVKFFVDIATQLVKIVDAIGPINIAVVGLFTYLAKQQGVFDGIFDGVFKPAEDSLEGLKQKLADAKKDFDDATQRFESSGNAKDLDTKNAQEQRVKDLTKKVERKSAEKDVDDLKQKQKELLQKQSAAQQSVNAPGATEEAKQDLIQINAELEKTNRELAEAQAHLVAIDNEEVGTLINDRDSFAQEVDEMKDKREELQNAINSGSSDDMLKLVEVDTASIDEDIEKTKEKLAAAQQDLLNAKAEPAHIKVNGGLRGNKDRDKHIKDASKEIADIEKDLDALQQKKADTIHYAAQFDLAEMDTAINDASDKLGGMTDAINEKTAAQIASNAATGAGAVADGAAAAANDVHTASTFRELIAQAVSTKMKWADVKAAGKQIILDKLRNSWLIKNAIAQGTLTATEAASAPITTLLSAGISGLAASFGSLWAALWPVLLIMAAIAVAIGAIVLLVKGIDALIPTAAELREELSGLKEEISGVKDEIDSLNDELETTQERMAELLAKDSLTFTEQEELDNLQKQNDELERQIYLLEQKEKRLQEQAQETFDALMKKNMANTKRDLDEDGEKDDVFDRSLERRIGQYKNRIEKYEEAQNELVKAEQELEAARDSGDERAIDRAKKKVKRKENKVKRKEKRKNNKKNQIDEELNQYITDAEGIDYDSADTKTRAYLDYINNTVGKIAILEGDDQAKTNEIKRIFNKDALSGAKAEIYELVKQLAEDPNNKTIITQISEQCELAKNDLAAVGLSVEDAKKYFTQLGSMASFDTLEGKMAEVARAATDFEALLGGKKFNVDGVEIGLADLFNKEGKVVQTTLSQVFRNTSAQTRQDITKLLEGSYEQIKNGTVDTQKLLEGFGLKAAQQVIGIQQKLLAEQNVELFPNLKDEIEGIIDKFDELSKAIGSVESAMDTLKKARAEEAYSGSVSIETLENLMQYTDDYAKLVEVDETGAIRLVANAEEMLIQQRREKIKADADAAVSAAQVMLAQAQYNEQAVNETGPVQDALTAATDWLAGSFAYLGSIISDVAAGNFTGMFDRANQAYDNKRGEREQNRAQVTVSVEDAQKALDNALLQQQVANAWANGTMQYSSEDASGGNDTKEDVEDDRFQKEMDYWENRISANQAKYSQLQNEIDLLEAKGQKADASFYEEQIKLENERKWLLEQQKAAAIARLEEIEAAGGEGNEQWWEVANTLNDIEGELDDVTASIVDFQDAIGEIDTYKFEEFNNRLDNMASKLETIRNLIAPDGEEDWFDDDGNWTESGVAVLGSYLQELETYKQGYAETVDELNKYSASYEGNESYYEALGIHSEQEWYDRTEELISQQYDFAESISDTEQSVVDMYESSIDAVEEYTETLIDSYKDYIDSVKEALDAERDLYDFKKNVQKQAKDIAEIERRIASLSGSTNAADIAERRKLEAQLYESRESLNDTYYDHAKDSQNEALDSEAAAYEESMTKFVEGLRTSLEDATSNMDEFLMGVTSMVMYNADTVLSKYEETNLPLTKELTNPWEEAKNATSSYSGNALDLMNQWTKEGGFFSQFNSTGTKNLQSPWSAGTTAANAFESSVETVMSGVVSNISTNVQTASTALSNLYKQIQDTEKLSASANVTVDNNDKNKSTQPNTPSTKTYSATAYLQIGHDLYSASGSGTSLSAAQSNAKGNVVQQAYNAYRAMGYDDSWLDKRYATWNSNVVFTKPTLSKASQLLNTRGYTKYAKGTTGTSRDEWTITDEPQFGDELVLVPGKDGNLSFMRKGTGVVPADLTANLMEWGQFTPDSMNLGNGVNVNMINNAVNKPEFNFAFDALVKAENITEETLPAVKKLVTQELNRFTKELNYALKGKGAR